MSLTGKVIGDAVVKVGADATGVGPEIKREVDKSSSGGMFSSVGKTIGHAVVAGMALGATGIAAVFAEGMNEGRIVQNMNAQFAAGIKSTGNAANLSVKGMDALAYSIANVSGQSVAVIGKTEQILQTFIKVRNVGVDKIFDQATLAAANMAAKMGGSTSRYALQLGKALQDPVKGMTALTRSGVVFDDQQKKMITSMVAAGNTIGAQKLILGELSREFGGAAAAAGGTLQGSLARVHVAFGQISESVVGFIIPIVTPAISRLASYMVALRPHVEKLIEKFKEWADSPAFKRGMATFVGLIKMIGEVILGKAVPAIVSLWKWLFANLGPALGKIIGFIHNFVSGMLEGNVSESFAGKIGDFLVTKLIPTLINLVKWVVATAKAWWPIIAAVVAGVAAWRAYLIVVNLIKIATEAWAAVQKALDAVMAANPIMLIVIAVAALIAIVVACYFKFAWFRDFINSVWQGIQAVVAAVIGWFETVFIPTFMAIWNTAWSIIKVAVEIIRGIIAVLAAIFFTEFNIIKAVVTTVFNAVWAVIKFVFNLIVSIVRSDIAVIMGIWHGIEAIVGWVSSAFTNVWNAMKSIGAQIWGWIGGWVSTIVQPFIDMAKNALGWGKDIVTGLWNGIKGAANWLKNLVMGWIKDVVPGPILKLMGINSPSKLMMEIGGHVADGLAVGMTNSQPKVISAANDLALKSSGGLTAGLHTTTSTTSSSSSHHSYEVNLTLQVSDLAQLKNVDEFLKMLDAAKIESRKTLRSGKVSA